MRRLKDEDDNSLIHYLAKGCFHTIISDKKYIEKKDLEIPGNMGKLPVHFTAHEGTKKEFTKQTIGFLLDNMEEPFKQDDLGNTVLHHALENKEDDVRYFLIFSKTRHYHRLS